MDLQAFKQRIQNTSLLTEEKKKHFLENAESYTPKIRTKMIKALEEHEKKFVKEGNALMAELFESQTKALNQKMLKTEAFHQKEVEDAEAQLLSDIEDL